MHGSIAADILDMIMEEKTNAVWTCITAPFGETTGYPQWHNCGQSILFFKTCNYGI
jgi:hypothetical protein